MPERTILKNISEMNQSEKQELLKKIEENRQEQIKTLRDTLEELQINPKEFEDVECLKYNIMASRNNSNFCACGIPFKRSKGMNYYKCGKTHCNVYGFKK